MLFNSFNFLIFFPIVVLLYYVIPKRLRMYWLLVASYYFYMCWNAKYIVLILFSTIITYACGLLMEHVRQKKYKAELAIHKIILVLGVLLNLSILFYFKYSNFAISILTKVFLRVHVQLDIPTVDVLLPVGISFYTFQALGYMVDVYRGEVYAEKNFFRYALFVSFFPQLVAGPIERSKNLLSQLAINHKFSYSRARDGLLLMLWGYFLKVVLADRITLFVDCVYSEYLQYPGMYLLIASALFAVQIYCDFSAYSTIAIGTAEMLGISLMENFNAPYLSQSVFEFWRRWHISLSSWFKDYVYIPLGGNRKGNVRKYINLMIVFTLSGLWHGASFTFVTWGALNGVFQIIGDLLQPIRTYLCKLFCLDRQSIPHKVVSMLGTFILIDFSWIFFRASGLTSAIGIVKSIITVHNLWIVFDGSIYKCGLDQKDFTIMIVCILLLLIVDMLKYKGYVIRKIIVKQEYWFRALVIVGAICFILVFGVWGPGYDAANFIYFQF